MSASDADAKLQFISASGVDGRKVELLTEDTVVYQSGNALIIASVSSGSERAIYFETDSNLQGWTVNHKLKVILAAVSGATSYIRAYSFPSLTCAWTLKASEEHEFQQVAVSSNGELVCALSSAPTPQLVLWSSANERVLATADLGLWGLRCLGTGVHAADAVSLSFSPEDGQHILLGCGSGLGVWTIAPQKGRVDLACRHEISASENSGNWVGHVWACTGDRVFSASSRGTLYETRISAADATTEMRVAASQLDSDIVAFLEADGFLLWANDDGHLTILSEEETPRVLVRAEVASEGIYTLSHLPKKELVVWDREGGRILASPHWSQLDIVAQHTGSAYGAHEDKYADECFPAPKQAYHLPLNHNGRFISLVKFQACSRDAGCYNVHISHSGLVDIWDNKTLVSSFTDVSAGEAANTAEVTSARGSRDGRLLAIGFSDGRVMLLDTRNVKTARALFSRKLAASAITEIACSPSSSQVAFGSWGNVWLLNTETLHVTQPEDVTHATHLQWIIDSQTQAEILAGVNGDRLLRYKSDSPAVWSKLTSSDEPMPLRVATTSKGSADDLVLLVADVGSKRARLMRLQSDVVLTSQNVVAHDMPISALAVSADGAHFATGSQDGSVVIYRAQPTAAADEAPSLDIVERHKVFAHGDVSGVAHIEFGGDGRTLCVWSEGGRTHHRLTLSIVHRPVHTLHLYPENVEQLQDVCKQLSQELTESKRDVAGQLDGLKAFVYMFGHAHCAHLVQGHGFAAAVSALHEHFIHMLTESTPVVQIAASRASRVFVEAVASEMMTTAAPDANLLMHAVAHTVGATLNVLASDNVPNDVAHTFASFVMSVAQSVQDSAEFPVLLQLLKATTNKISSVRQLAFQAIGVFAPRAGFDVLHTRTPSSTEGQGDATVSLEDHASLSLHSVINLLQQGLGDQNADVRAAALSCFKSLQAVPVVAELAGGVLALLGPDATLSSTGKHETVIEELPQTLDSVLDRHVALQASSRAAFREASRASNGARSRLRAETSLGGGSLNADLDMLRSRMMDLTTRNSAAPELEKLDAKVMSIDSDTEAQLREGTQSAAAQAAAAIAKINLEHQFLAHRIKEECWTPMETKAVALVGLADNTIEVRNFPVRKALPDVEKGMRQLVFLRKLQLLERDWCVANQQQLEDDEKERSDDGMDAAALTNPSTRRARLFNPAHTISTAGKKYIAHLQCVASSTTQSNPIVSLTATNPSSGAAASAHTNPNPNPTTNPNGTPNPGDASGSGAPTLPRVGSTIGTELQHSATNGAMHTLSNGEGSAAHTNANSSNNALNVSSPSPLPEGLAPSPSTDVSFNADANGASSPSPLPRATTSAQATAQANTSKNAGKLQQTPQRIVNPYENLDASALMFHPFECTTNDRKRTQAALFQRRALTLRKEFNKTFESLHDNKQREIEKIQEKITRCLLLEAEIFKLNEGTAQRERKEQKRMLERQRRKELEAQKPIAGTTLRKRRGAANNNTHAGHTTAAHTTTDVAHDAAHTDASTVSKPQVDVKDEDDPSEIEKRRRLHMEQAAKDLVCPRLLKQEIVDAVLSVTDDEIKVEKVASAQERQKKSEELQRKMALADDGSDHQRALQEMMNGRLETDSTSQLLDDVLIKEDWMIDIPEAQMTDEQKQAFAVYQRKEKAVLTERQTHLKTAMSELKKLKSEIQDAVRTFDTKLSELFAQRLECQRQVHQLHLASIALLSLVLDDLESSLHTQTLENELESIKAEKGKLKVQLVEWQPQLEGQNKLLEELQINDRSLDKKDAFRKYFLEHGEAPSADATDALFKAYRSRARKAKQPNGGSVSNTLTPRKSQIYHRSMLSSVSILSGKFNLTGLMDSLAQGQSPRGQRSSVIKSNAHAHAHNKDGNAQQERRQSAFEVSMKAAFEAEVSPEEKARAEIISTFSGLDHAAVPEGLGITPGMWSLLHQRRAEKMQSEIQTKLQSLKVAEARHRIAELETHEAGISERARVIQKELSTHKEQKSLQALNAELTVEISHGLVEVEEGPVVTEYNDAELVARSVVETLNAAILHRGGEVVEVLQAISKARRTIRLHEWRTNLLNFELNDVCNTTKELQLLRVTKGLQSVIKAGGQTGKRVAETEALERKLDWTKSALADQDGQKESELEALLRKIKKEQRENAGLRVRVMELQQSVRQRQDICTRGLGGSEATQTLTSTGEPWAIRLALSGLEGDTGSASYPSGSQTVRAPKQPRAPNPGVRSPRSPKQGPLQIQREMDARQRLALVAEERKLQGIARAQSEDVAILRAERDRLRLKTYPTFAHTQTAAHSYPHHEGEVRSPRAPLPLPGDAKIEAAAEPLGTYRFETK